MKSKHLNLPMLKPEDVIPHLGRGELHWKKGYSAQEMALCWFNAKGIPEKVKSVLDRCDDYKDVELVDAFFERDVKLREGARPSQTDLMVIAGRESDLAIIAIEAKVEEPFGPTIDEWNDGSDGKTARLESLCDTLGLNSGDIGSIRYQLLHRTASAIYEAQRYRCNSALMLVQSFSEKHSWFDDFKAFSEAMKQTITKIDTISPAKSCEDVKLRLGWCADTN